MFSGDIIKLNNKRGLFILSLLGIFLVVILSTSSCQTGKSEKDAAEKKKKELAPGEAPPLKAKSYAIPEVCGSCHDEIFNQWQGSMHNNAFIDEIYLKVYEIGSKETEGEIDEFCVACHSPIAFIAKEIPPFIGTEPSMITKKGIQCDFYLTYTPNCFF